MSEPTAGRPPVPASALLRTLEATTDFVGLTDAAGRVLWINPAGRRLMGFAESDDVGATSIPDYHPPDVARRLLTQALPEAVARGVWQGESTLRTRAGREIPVSQVIVAQKDETGAVRHFSTILRDVSERRRVEEDLRESQRFASKIVESSPHTVYVFDLVERRMVYCSSQIFRDLGYSAAELRELGDGLLPRLLHPDDVARLPELLGARRDAADVDVVESESRLRHRDGSWRWFRYLNTVFQKDPDGRVRQVIGTSEDVTAKRLADERLRASEERYRTLFEHAPEAVVVFDVDAGRFIDANEPAVRLFGLPREELLTKGPVDLSAARTADGRPAGPVARDYLDRALAGETPRFEWIHRHASGRDVLCEIRLVRLPHPERRLIRGSVTDLSERRRLEEHLAQAQKVGDLGRLAGGIAHDFNNLLTAVLGYVEETRRLLGPEAPAREPLGRVEEAAVRGAELTRQLLGYARRQVARPVVLDLRDEVGATAGLLRRLIGEHVELSLVRPPGPVRAKVDPGQLSQILVNLAVNARDAMPSGGKLIVECSRIDVDEAWCRQHPELRPGAYAVVAVSDTGTGIPPDVMPRIFEPFFTTKPRGQGTGLGLATCFGIAKQNAGHLSAYSEPGRGSTFRLYLPETAESPAPPSPAPPALGGPGGTETLLLVEDEESIRSLALRILGRLGYTVHVAADGQEALDLAAGLPKLDLLVTDVVMPRLGGAELARRLRGTRPGLRVLYTSGYTEDAIVHQGILAEDVAFLQKPYTVSALAARIREALRA